MSLHFQLDAAVGAGEQGFAAGRGEPVAIALTPADYNGRPYATAELTACYTAALDAAATMGCNAVTLPTLGVARGWPPRFAVPTALAAVDTWQKKHPESDLAVTLCAPDRLCYELYEEFSVLQKRPACGAVVGFFHEYGVNGWFSNWYPAVFTVEGVTYYNAEQYLMHRKALCCGDTDTARKIMEDPDPRTVKLLGRSIACYDEEKWSAARPEVIRRGLLAKFGQNSGLGWLLLSTGDALIAECSPNDAIWGIGLGLEDPRSADPTQWQGQNLLGRALMEVRESLRQ